MIHFTQLIQPHRQGFSWNDGWFRRQFFWLILFDWKQTRSYPLSHARQQNSTKNTHRSILGLWVQTQLIATEEHSLPLFFQYHGAGSVGHLLRALTSIYAICSKAINQCCSEYKSPMRSRDFAEASILNKVRSKNRLLLLAKYTVPLASLPPFLFVLLLRPEPVSCACPVP